MLFPQRSLAFSTNVGSESRFSHDKCTPLCGTSVSSHSHHLNRSQIDSLSSSCFITMADGDDRSREEKKRVTEQIDGKENF